MKIIKSFESFDFNQTLPAASKETLTLFYSCDECNALWKEFNISSDSCRFCKSDEFEEIGPDEYYELVKSRLDKEEIEDLDLERESDSETIFDLTKLK
jgi:hypothetical protein